MLRAFLLLFAVLPALCQAVENAAGSAQAEALWRKQKAADLEAYLEDALKPTPIVGDTGSDPNAARQSLSPELVDGIKKLAAAQQPPTAEDIERFGRCLVKPVPVIVLQSSDVQHYPLIVSGSPPLRLDLLDRPRILLSLPDGLLIRYNRARYLAHRYMTLDELGGTGLDTTPAQIVQLMFGDLPRLLSDHLTGNGDAVKTRPTAKVLKWAAGMRRASCTMNELRHYRVAGLDVYASLSRSRVGRYTHIGFYVINGDQVLYIDISASESFALEVLSTLRRHSPGEGKLLLDPPDSP